jgi:hypothetical protein
MTVEMMKIENIQQRAAKKPRFEPYRRAIRDPKPTPCQRTTLDAKGKESPVIDPSSAP